MPTGTPLSVLRQMLNCEVGEEMDETISPARIGINNLLLNNQQAFLYGQHAFIQGKTRATLPLVALQQFISIYTPINGAPLCKLIDLDRPETTEFVNYQRFRFALRFGIGQMEYNVYNSSYGVAGVPIMKWDIVNNQALVTAPGANYSGSSLTYTGLLPGQQYQWIPGVNEVSLTYNGQVMTAQDFFTVVPGVTTATVAGAGATVAYTGVLNTVGRMIEVWPIPSTPQSLELAGTLPLTKMENDTDTCVIDDLLLVLATATQILARDGKGDAAAMGERFKAHLASIRSSYPMKLETLNISGGFRHVAGFDRTGGNPTIAVQGALSQ